MKIEKRKSLVELIASLPKPKIPKNFNWKEEYYKSKKKKYKL
ncbi:MAG: hypothetical protein ACKOWO_04230 [Sediminibacterium sp.]